MGLLARLLGREKQGAYESHDRDGNGEAHDSRLAVRPVEVAAPPKRNRQDMLDELEQSYREVVDLVGKLKSHMEREEQRSARLMEITEGIGGVLPRIEDSGRSAAERMIEAIERTDSTRQEIGYRIESVLSAMADQTKRSSETQEQLSSTVGELNATMLDVSRSTGRSADVLHVMREQSQAREEQFTKLVGEARRSMTLAMYVALSMGAIAVAVAAIALVQVFAGSGS